MRTRCVVSSFASFFYLLSSEAFAADYNIRCGAIDPEVHQELRVMTWQEPVLNASTDKAMMADIIWFNGRLDDDVYELGDDVVKYLFSQAGPKFANGSDGIHLVYTGGVYGEREIPIYKYNADCPPGGNDSACFYLDSVIASVGSEERFIVYTTEEENLDFHPAMAVYKWWPDEMEPTELRWRELSGSPTPTERVLDDATVPFGRLHAIKAVQNQQVVDKLITVTTRTVPDPADDPDDQVFIVDAIEDPAPAPTQITTDDGKRWNPFAWFDPRYGKNMIVSRYEPPEGGRSDLEILRENPLGSGNWSLLVRYGFERLDELDKPYLLSPEAFVWDGISYIVFSSSTHLAVAEQTDGNIWVIEVLDPNDPNDNEVTAIRVNDRTFGKRPRNEGEVFYKFGGPVIYYMYQRDDDDVDDCTQFDDDEQNLLDYSIRMATTGL
jgi:hypothetical protein